jgi:uncharacterized protein YdaU (DUF1376 family)
MSAPPFMQLYVADYLGDTRHLSTEQHGAYLLLLMAMWRASGELPNDPAKLARMTGLTPSRWAKIGADVLAFFQCADGVLTHKRVTSELKKSQRTSEVRSEAGARGAEAKSLKTNKPTEAIAVDLPEQNASPAEAYQISDIREITDADASVVPRRRRADAVQVWDDAFSAAWEAYPKSGRDRSMSRVKCWPLWREAAQQAGGPEKLLAAVRHYTAHDKTHRGDCGAPAFDRWLKWGRWEHHLGAVAMPRAIQVFPDPEIRNAVIVEKGEAWAASWLDPCSWEPERRVIVPRNGLAAQRLRSEVMRVLQARHATIQELAA